MSQIPGSEATSPWQQEEEGPHPANEGDLADKSYTFQEAAIRQDQQIRVHDTFKHSSNKNCAKKQKCSSILL